MGEFERAEWPRQIIGGVLGGCVITGLWFLSFRFIPDVGLNSFLVFSLGLINAVSIWFGAWGILSAFLATFAIFDVSGLTWILLVVVFLQALIPAWAFRHFKADPRLKTGRDLKTFLVYDVAVASLATAFIVYLNFSLTVGNGYAFSALTLLFAIAYFILSFFARIPLDFLLLRLFSGTIVKARAYCKGWLA